ncbi:acetolactate decarboxylase [Streptomyces sp. NPDC090080]|uniref:acetolactate decarboxylase n=1 Tax=Streptomyces sp. NPDC090080 TaxID=3365939 RepID=UPI0037F8FD87
MNTAPRGDSREDFHRWSRAVLAHHRARAGAGASRAVYQTSTISALLDGVYDGDVTVGELLEHGDFGLGTFNRLDGEMLVLDGVCYHLRADGSVRPAGAEELTPFAAVTRFAPDMTLRISEPCDRNTLLGRVDAAIGSENLLCAVRVTGRFAVVHTRTVMAQTPPYPPLTEAAAGQREAVFHDVDGILAGYRTPAFEQGVSVAGHHLHFLDGSRRHAGHALGFRMRHGTVDISSASALDLSLPRTPEFLRAHLARAGTDRAIRQAEGGS